MRISHCLLSAIGAVALLVVSCASDDPSVERRQPPKLVFTQTTHVLGHLDAGRQVTQAYPFRNTGGLDLSIDNVRAACTCTAAVPSGRVIPPGGEGVIGVTFDTTHEHGHQTRTITVYSNDPVQPVTTLTLVADIDAAVVAEPSELYIGHVQRGMVAPNAVRLLGTGGGASGPVETTGTVLDATVAIDAKGTATTLHVAIKPGAPLGRFKESVLVHTHNGRQPLTIPVVGIVDPDGASASRERH